MNIERSAKVQVMAIDNKKHFMTIRRCNEVSEGKLVHLVSNPDFEGKIRILSLRNFQTLELCFLDFDFQQASFDLASRIVMDRGNVWVHTSHSLKIVNINYIESSSLLIL